MGTCSELRQPTTNLKPPTYATGWKYGFSDKVVDGVTVSVNSLVINFKSPAFEASLQVCSLVKYIVFQIQLVQIFLDYSFRAFYSSQHPLLGSMVIYGFPG